MGATVAIIETCLGKVADLDFAAKSETTSNGMVTTVGGPTGVTLGKIAALLGKALDVCCAFKTLVVSLITLGKRRRYRKKFIKGKTSTNLLGKNLFDNIGDAFKCAGDAIADVTEVAAN